MTHQETHNSQIEEDIITAQSREIPDHSRIILVGRAASGKDYMRKIFEKRGMKYGVSYTTRPPREGELDGKDYHFITEEKFKDMIDKREWYEYVQFNGWYYGTSLEQFYRDDIFIMTPKGISQMKKEDRDRSFIIYIDIPEDIRRERLKLRSDADTVERRIAADREDFEGFENFDIRITNPLF
jgi:guanylate kinase